MRIVTLHYRSLEIPGQAFTEVARRIAVCIRCERRALVPVRLVHRNGLVGGCRHVVQQLAQMGAALNTAQRLFDGVPPARTHLDAQHFLHRLLCLWTFEKRPAVHHGKNFSDGQGLVYGHANQHVVNRRAWRHYSLIGRHHRIGLGIGHSCLDVPQAVFTQKTVIRSLPVVQVFSGEG